MIVFDSPPSLEGDVRVRRQYASGKYKFIGSIALNKGRYVYGQAIQTKGTAPSTEELQAIVDEMMAMAKRDRELVDA